VEKWLSGQFTYTLHKQVKRNFKRNPVIASYVDEQWQADLVDMKEFESQNDGYKYLITIIDIFSKYAWVYPLKDKSAVEVTKTLKKFFKLRKPSKFQTDQGKEFVNSSVKKLMIENDINFFVTRNTDIKCAVVERFNKTLRGRMFRYFTSKGTRRYVDVLDSLVNNYNKTWHSSIKMTPVMALKADKNKIFKNLYGFDSKRELLIKKSKNKTKLSEKDLVRVPYKKQAFDKGYYPNWTDETYKIKKVKQKLNKPVFELTDKDNNELKQSFYPEQVQKIFDNEYRIEKIIKEKRVRGKLLFFVKWTNYPDSYNSWIPANQVRNL